MVYDIVCPVRTGNRNNELRYALRSWADNLPHRNVHIFGAPPAWTENTINHPMRQGSNPNVNTSKMMELACDDPEISNPFIWLNDDIFVMKKITEVPRMHRGPIDLVIASRSPNQTYIQGMVATKNLLVNRGFSEFDLLSYELHMPMLIYKTSMLHALEDMKGSPVKNLHKRTIYGNLIDYGGIEVADNKINQKAVKWDENCTFISTSDTSFERHPVGAWIKSKFLEKSIYEK